MKFIPQVFLESIFLHAEREAPAECCGVILGFSGEEKFSRVRPLKNAQDEYHRQDPKNFSRTSQEAYFMDPKELLALQKELRASEEEIRVIYHSHINAPAYFSEEDKRMALLDGEPVYPGVDYLVISVAQGSTQEACLYRWDPKEKEFLLIETSGGFKNVPD